MTTINHTPAGEQRGKKRLIHRFSWVSLLVCWLIWVLNAYDREMILRLGPVISKEFSLSPEQWGNIVALIMVALAVLDIPGSIWSDRYGLAGNERAFRYRWCWAIPRCLLFPGLKRSATG
jgi:nitrate/nitrite transporter NarK